jgi:hypothetical protein
MFYAHPHPAPSSGSKEIYLADLADFKNLIEAFQHITLEQVMAFATWFMGDDRQLMTLCHPSDMTMKCISTSTPLVI